MKKLITLAVAILAVTALHAASVNWGGDTVNSANTTGLTGNGSETDADYEGYATAGTVYTLILMGDTQPSAPSSYDSATGLTDKGGSVVGTHTLTQAEASQGSFQDKYIASADDMNGNWYMVTVYDPTTKTADSTTFQINGATDSGGAYDGITPMASLGSSMGSIEVVPEPCSVALLALGLAALGLKRKVA